MKRPALVTVAGLAAGLIAGALLPSHWIFVEAPRDAHAGHAMGDSKYACPMFCTIMDQPPDDGRCPVCGMDMTPISAQSTLNPQERRMIGLVAERLERLPLARSIRVVGEVDYDETRVSRITTRVAGWLETVTADTNWARVRKGDPLAAIYSPELYAAQQEFVVALEANDERLRRAAERRLELLGVGAAEIEQLRKKRAVQESLLLRAPRDGVVIERRAETGAAVRMGDLLYAVADLSRVWVQAEVYERDLPWVFVGQPVRIRWEGGGDGVEGRVAFIDPVVGRRSRTARVRIEVENPAGDDGTRRLRIGQRADAWIEARVDADGKPGPAAGDDAAEPLSVPRTAVLSTGERRIVYLLFTENMGRRDYELDPENLPETVFYQLVPVRLGPGASAGRRERYPLLGLDLTDAERRDLQLQELTETTVVVTHGNLLLDSQAQLSGKPSLLFPEGSRGSADPHAGH